MSSRPALQTSDDARARLISFYLIMIVAGTPFLFYGHSFSTEFVTETKYINGGKTDMLQSKKSFSLSNTTLTFRNEDPYGATDYHFTGEPVRAYVGEWKFRREKRDRNAGFSDSHSCHFPLLGKLCDQWAVITTTDHGPTEAVKRAVSLENWCMVIVADTKTPENYLEEMTSADTMLGQRGDIVYLSIQKQRQLRNCFVESMPFNSFSRKNVGYLYAIRHGAKVIFDCDDNNILKSQATEKDLSKAMPPWTSQPNINPQNIRVKVKTPMRADCPSSVINPYSYLGPSIKGVWPRGFPLQNLDCGNDSFNAVTDDNSRLLLGDISIDQVGIIQLVADSNPDVDVIYRSTRTLPLTFEDNLASLKLLIPENTFAPYNSQATLHFYNSFWGMLLPQTVTERVSDIWRGYFTQRIMHDLNIALVFAPPLVFQERNEHNFLAEMDAENDLFTRTKTLVDFLSSWQKGKDSVNGDMVVENSLPTILEYLWVTLYERDYIGLADVKALQQWLQTLIQMGYQFPSTEDKQESWGFVEQPTLHGQPFTALPAYNVAGDDKLTFQEYIVDHESEQNAWENWLSSAIQYNDVRPIHRVMKIVLMTKDECPPLMDWTLYHGKLIGFHNLYIIDSSTDKHCTSFLMHARDSFGVNVLFSPANLNQVETELNTVMGHLAGSSDFMIKVDTDEFVALYDENGACGALYPFNSSFNEGANVKCVVTPYGLQEYLDSMELDSSRFMVGPTAGSIANEKNCDAGLGDNLGMQAFVVPSGLVKVFFDSRTFKFVDLGSHEGASYGDQKRPSRLSLFHFHFRCYEQMIESCRKAVIGHNYISETDTEVEALTKLRDLCLGNRTCDKYMDPDECNIGSKHKIAFYAANLTCYDATRSNFYGSDPASGHSNPHFDDFLKESITDYSF